MAEFILVEIKELDIESIGNEISDTDSCVFIIYDQRRTNGEFEILRVENYEQLLKEKNGSLLSYAIIECPKCRETFKEFVNSKRIDYKGIAPIVNLGKVTRNHPITINIPCDCQ